MVDGQPAPLALVVWEMAEHFGWTLEYVENLSLARLYEWVAVANARAKGQDEAKRRKAFLSRKR